MRLYFCRLGFVTAQQSGKRPESLLLRPAGKSFGLMPLRPSQAKEAVHKGGKGH